ncbi:MAG: DUF2497 domain-containing protein [Pseudomonadota bacterium]
MAQPSPTAEPSMEEILASIRRIISDEHTEQADEAVAAPAAPAQQAADAPGASPIPISDTIEDLPEPMPAASADEDEALSLELPSAAALEPDEAAQALPRAADEANAEPMAELQPPQEEALALPEVEAPLASDNDLVLDDLVEDEPFVLDAPIEPPSAGTQGGGPEAPNMAEQLVDTALATMPGGLLEPETDAAVASGFRQLEQALAAHGRSIDELTDDILRPMVKTWLDDNLPQMVERLVREEIQRVARG